MAKPIQEFLKMAVDADASDLHITTYIPPRIRVNGSLKVHRPPAAHARPRPRTSSTAS